jgi:hypothetical protein
VNFRYCIAVDRREKIERIKVVIDRVDVDIVDVEQQFAAGTLGDFGDEVPLRHRVVGKPHVGRYVLDQDRSAQCVLHLFDALADDPERLFGER